MSRGVSGSYARISQIKDRLNSIQTSLDSDRFTRTEEFEKKLKSLEDSVWTTQEQTSRKFASIKEVLGRLTHSQEEERQAHDGFVDEISNDFVAMEDAATELLRHASASRREFEGKVGRLIEERIISAAQDVNREAKLSSESCEQLSAMIDQQIPPLESRIKSLANERAELAKQAQELIADETARLKEVAEGEGANREESENALLSLMREVTERIRTDLGKEKNEREAAEETLLSLLEDTCSKIKALS